MEQPGKWWRRSRTSAHFTLVRELDLSILLTALVLAGVGVLMIYSATHAYPALSRLYLKQLVWLGLGTLGLLTLASTPYHVLLDRFAWPSYVLLLALLALLLATGQEVAGSKRWFTFGPAAVQPSEFAKLATVLVLTKFLVSREARIGKWDTLLGALLIAGAPMLLILRQPDLGTALVFAGMLGVMLFTAGVPVHRLATLLGIGLLSTPLVWVLLKDYQRQRLLVYLNPNADVLGAGYNVLQSKIAVGSGQLWGKGWLQGTQGQLRFVPEHHTDFIFSVLAEEWGFLGSLVLLLLFTVLLLQALRVARQARETGGSLLAVGLTALLAVQVIINLCVAIGLLPVTGMTLPLISYGGSSLLVTLCLIGILLNIWSGRIVR